MSGTIIAFPGTPPTTRNLEDEEDYRDELRFKDAALCLLCSEDPDLHQSLSDAISANKSIQMRSLMREFFEDLKREGHQAVKPLERVGLATDHLKRLVFEQGITDGVMVFASLGSGARERSRPRLRFDFSLEADGRQWEILHIAGCGVDQLLRLRKVLNKGKPQYRFYCERCDRLRFNELAFYRRSDLAEFICDGCPESPPFRVAWRYRGGYYLLNAVEAVCR